MTEHKPLIPQVAEFIKGTGYFAVTPDMCITAASLDAAEPAELLAEYLRPATGFELPVKNTSADPCGIILEERGQNTPDDDGFFDESYSIEVTADAVYLTAAGKAGLCRGIQTLRQLMPYEIYSSCTETVQWHIPVCTVSDKPRFRWRGVHLDVARHFFAADEVCRYIELAAQHKFNIFHWHLTDDQGWRIEIKKYPRLTEKGAWRKTTLVGHVSNTPHRFDGLPYGGFYTQDDIRRIVAFAARRGITVVPEIDMPGHMQAAIAAYPELGNNPSAQLDVWPLWGVSRHILNARPETIEFMKDVLSEILELFPSRYIHIGGDEALKTEWLDNVQANILMAETQSENAEQLQTYFILQIAEFLASHGRKAVGWDDVLAGGMPPDTAIMNWREPELAVQGVKNGAKVIMAPNQYTYFDMYQADSRFEPLSIGGDLPCEKVYRFDAIPPGLDEAEASLILGGQGQIWTEYIESFAKVEYMLYPRACALAEKLWTDGSKCRFRNFLNRLNLHRRRLELQNVNAHALP